ncbi:FAD-dependent oxidoreductase [Peribacillus sp. SCS-37]|uniref:FAD-dependent oxidoreductase n=1 Tax=Paraperibacillus esterisolvens TaxID=3115296 RepID=UPI00390632C6
MKRRSARISLLVLFFLLGYGVIFYFSAQKAFVHDEGALTDVSRLMPVKVKRIAAETTEEGIKETVLDAAENDLKVSIAGKMHSQGGHTYYRDSVVIDMTGFKKVLEVDPEKQTVRVQSGATWDDIQKAINPYGLAVKVMQSQNIFTIGGSLSVNVHGRDIRNGSLISTVRSLRLLKPDGKIINVSRAENSDYFPYVIGGYGLFGVILDAELELTRNELYSMRSTVMSYDEYPRFFKEKVRGDKAVRMHLARISTAPDGFLRDMYATDYMLADNQDRMKDHEILKDDSGTMVTKPMLGLSRKSGWGKDLLWNLQQKYFLSKNGDLISRNNVMRSESAFLEYYDENSTDILQEYFVPADDFPAYIDDLRSLLEKEDLNLLNITVRFVEKDNEAVLSYSKRDMFSLVLLINQGLTKEDRRAAKRTIRKMIDVTLDHNGSYYLPYYKYPTKKQMQKAYPRTGEFFEQKRRMDPDERFMNYFYEEYGK